VSTQQLHNIILHLLSAMDDAGNTDKVLFKPAPNYFINPELKARVLVVEDNIPNQHVALGILKKLGMHGATADNGLDAIDILKQEEFDIVLMDVQMPVMDGYEAASIIRNPESGVTNSQIPIIAMTAH